MADETTKEVKEEVKVKMRRGVNNETRATSRLKFSHEDAKANGLFIGHLDDITLSNVDMADNSAMVSFRGIPVKRLSIIFASNDESVNKRKYATLSFLPVESNVNTIPNGKEAWKVDHVLAYLKHLLDVFVLHGNPMPENMENLLSLDYEDFDENGEYLQVDAETVVNAWTKLFENFINIMNTAKQGKPAYKDANGKPISIWFKLLRYVKNNKGWTPINNEQLGFPTFVGEGVFEIFVANVKPSIKLDVVREAIKPMEGIGRKKPNLNIPGIGGGVVVTPALGVGSEMGGLGIGGGVGDVEDMPEDLF